MEIAEYSVILLSLEIAHTVALTLSTLWVKALMFVPGTNPVREARPRTRIPPHRRRPRYRIETEI